MGYTTEFWGEIQISPPLSAEEVAYLKTFSETRRMRCTQGPYYVEREGFTGQMRGADVLDYNLPPGGQPGLWCQWLPTDDGNAIEWDQGEKFYDSAAWMKYLIEHFIGKDPLAQKELPFLAGHTCNGEIEAQGEDNDDRWKIIVKDNRVSIATASLIYGEPEEI